jgi:hypothetical protein
LRKVIGAVLLLNIWSRSAVDRNGRKNVRTDHAVKGAKRRLRRSKTLDSVICSEKTLAVAIDGFL